MFKSYFLLLVIDTQGLTIRKLTIDEFCPNFNLVLIFSVSVASRPQDCVWSSWGAWSSCSITCGPGPGTQRRTRPVQIHPTPGGLPCSDPDSFETVLCSLEEPCPENDTGQLLPLLEEL